jgi:hypothetical protein
MFFNNNIGSSTVYFIGKQKSQIKPKKLLLVALYEGKVKIRSKNQNFISYWSHRTNKPNESCENLDSHFGDNYI